MAEQRSPLPFEPKGSGKVAKEPAGTKQEAIPRYVADLCDRIPTNVLNRRGLESLIHCGAMDAMDPDANRAQLMADLDLLLDWASFSCEGS